MATVFSHIIQKRFSSVNEDVATDALAYILESSPAARRGMQNLIAGCAATIPELTFKTQQTEGSIRPDMWGYAGTQPHVYIENKFWAGLTDNQPVSYLKELAKCGTPSVLLVVAPEKRQLTLWRELQARLQAAGISIADDTPQGGNTHVVNTSAGPVMALTSWTALLSTLEMQTVDDPAARNDISQLRALCEAADSEAFLPISAETLSDQRTPKLMLQLSDLVQGIVDKGVSKKVLFIDRLRPQSSAERIGRYSHFGEDRRVGSWLGIHFRLWRSYGRTPLWVVLSNTAWGRADFMQSIIAPWAKEHAVFTTRDENGDYVIALQIPANEEKSAVVSAIVNQLEAMYHLMPVPDQATLANATEPAVADE
jgi:hypothetical protein